MAQQVIKIAADNGSRIMRVLDVLTPLNGVVAPAVHAKFIGQFYIDTTAKLVYISVAINSAVITDDWKKLTFTA